MGMTPGGGDSGPGLGRGESGLTGVASGEDLGVEMERGGGERGEGFWAVVVAEGGFGGVDLVAEVGLGAGMKPGGGDKGEGLGAGIKPTTGGRDEVLEWEDLEEVGGGTEFSEVVLLAVTATTGDLTCCITGAAVLGLELTSCGFGVGLFSFFVSCGSTFSSFFSFFFSNSIFSGRSSLRIRGRGSLVLPLTIRLLNPREMSSLSSVLMTSCLKENPDIIGALDTKAGAGTTLTGSGPGLATCGASDACVGAVDSSSSVGRTFLTTRRTTFTTFLHVRPWSSVVSVWLVLVHGPLILPLAVLLTALLPIMPFCSRSLFITGTGLIEACGGSGLLNRSAIFGGGSGLLKRSGTVTGVLTLGGEGLLTRPTNSVGENDGGLFARNNPLPGSRAGTDLARLDSPSVSDYSQRGKRGGMRERVMNGNPSITFLFMLSF